MVREQLDLLQIERRNYSSRLMALADQPDRCDEMSGYIGLIENINLACIRLARAAGLPDQAHTPSALAA